MHRSLASSVPLLFMTEDDSLLKWITESRDILEDYSCGVLLVRKFFINRDYCCFNIRKFSKKILKMMYLMLLRYSIKWTSKGTDWIHLRPFWNTKEKISVTDGTVGIGVCIYAVDFDFGLWLNRSGCFWRTLHDFKIE